MIGFLNGYVVGLLTPAELPPSICLDLLVTYAFFPVTVV